MPCVITLKLLLIKEIAVSYRCVLLYLEHRPALQQIISEFKTTYRSGEILIRIFSQFSTSFLSPCTYFRLDYLKQQPHIICLFNYDIPSCQRISRGFSTNVKYPYLFSRYSHRKLITRYVDFQTFCCNVKISS